MIHRSRWCVSRCSVVDGRCFAGCLSVAALLSVQDIGKCIQFSLVHPRWGSTKYCKFVISMSVCLFVCSSVRDHVSRRTRRSSPIFMCVMSWPWRSDTSRIPVFGVIFAHVNWLLDVAVRWRQRAVTYAALVWRVGIGLGPPFWGIEITSSGPRKMSFGFRQSFVVRHGIPNDIKEIRR